METLPRELSARIQRLEGRLSEPSMKAEYSMIVGELILSVKTLEIELKAERSKCDAMRHNLRTLASAGPSTSPRSPESPRAGASMYKNASQAPQQRYLAKGGDLHLQYKSFRTNNAKASPPPLELEHRRPLPAVPKQTLGARAHGQKGALQGPAGQNGAQRPLSGPNHRHQHQRLHSASRIAALFSEPGSVRSHGGPGDEIDNFDLDDIVIDSPFVSALESGAHAPLPSDSHKKKAELDASLESSTEQSSERAPSSQPPPPTLKHLKNDLPSQAQENLPHNVTLPVESWANSNPSPLVSPQDFAELSPEESLTAERVLEALYYSVKEGVRQRMDLESAKKQLMIQNMQAPVTPQTSAVTAPAASSSSSSSYNSNSAQSASSSHAHGSASMGGSSSALLSHHNGSSTGSSTNLSASGGHSVTSTSAGGNTNAQDSKNDSSTVPSPTLETKPSSLKSFMKKIKPKGLSVSVSHPVGLRVGSYRAEQEEFERIFYLTKDFIDTPSAAQRSEESKFPEGFRRRLGILKESLDYDVDFSDCDIYVIPPFVLDNLCKTTRLTLSDNRLTEIPNQIRKFDKLEEFNLANNLLVRIPGAISHLRCLRTLNASNNKITEIPLELAYLPLLEFLNLSENQITEVPKHIGWLHSLKHLNISNNPITVLANELSLCSRLQSLEASTCFLKKLPKEIVCLSELEVLDVSHNNLKELPIAIGLLTKLSQLRVENNQLSDLPVSIGWCGSLVTSGELSYAPNPLNTKIFSSVLDGETSMIEFVSIRASHNSKQLSKLAPPQVPKLPVIPVFKPVSVDTERWTLPEKMLCLGDWVAHTIDTYLRPAISSLFTALTTITEVQSPLLYKVIHTMRQVKTIVWRSEDLLKPPPFSSNIDMESFGSTVPLDQIKNLLTDEFMALDSILRSLQPIIRTAAISEKIGDTVNVVNVVHFTRDLLFVLVLDESRASSSQAVHYYTRHVTNSMQQHSKQQSHPQANALPPRRPARSSSTTNSPPTSPHRASLVDSVSSNPGQGQTTSEASTSVVPFYAASPSTSSTHNPLLRHQISKSRLVRTDSAPTTPTNSILIPLGGSPSKIRTGIPPSSPTNIPDIDFSQATARRIAAASHSEGEADSESASMELLPTSPISSAVSAPPNRGTASEDSDLSANEKPE